MHNVKYIVNYFLQVIINLNRSGGVPSLLLSSYFLLLI